MSNINRWNNSHSRDDNVGILRKKHHGDLYNNDSNNKNLDDLLIFGYSCKLFRDDEKATYVDQGKHLIPWMGDESLKIDRYDCRGNMTHSELSVAEAKVDGINWLQLLSNEEQRAEKLCDEERYRALYTNEDEEEMYREEELKRLHMMARGSSYGQVQFNYEGDSGEGSTAQVTVQEQEIDKDDEPFEPSPQLNLPEGMPLPQSKKLNAIIEKTAMFIANQGAQMEILLKAKQAGNPQFDFLSMECPLHRYYTNMLQAIRERRYLPQQENKPQEKQEEYEHYLHPSLAPVSVESAPSIPSIAYKPSADCAYSMLVNQIKGKDPTKQENNDTTTDAIGKQESDIAPPGTETLPLPALESQYQDSANTFSKMNSEQMRSYASYPFVAYNADIAKGPVMYSKDNEEQRQTVKNVVPQSYAKDEKVSDGGFDSNVSSPRSVGAVKSGPIKLIHYSDSDSASDSDSCMSNFTSKPRIPQPPHDQQLIIDKMASYVAKNGDTFEQIVKVKGDPRFSFLNANHEFYPYYKNKRQFYENVNRKEYAENNEGLDNKTKGPVSFSIKKMKEPEPILPKPALPYESTSDEDGTDNENSKDSTKTKDETKTQQQTAQETPVINKSVEPTVNPIVTTTAPIVVKPVPVAKPVPIIQPMPFLTKSSTVKTVPSNVSMLIDPKTIYHVQNDVQPMEKRVMVDKIDVATANKYLERKRRKSKEKKVYKADKSPHNSSGEEDRDRRRKRKRHHESRSFKRVVSEDVITLEDDEVLDRGSFIDLTEDDRMGYKRDARDRERKEDVDSDDDERKRKAAAFLSTLKDIPTLATQQQSSLASAMVKTLHSYNRKKEEEEKSRKKKSKKHKRTSRSRSYSSDSDREDGGGSRSHSNRYHGSGRHSKHSKKSKKSSRDERSSKSKANRRTSPSEERNSGSKEKSVSSRKKFKSLEEQQKHQHSKPKRHNDKLLTTSLKELVKETRKDFIASEPIKMAVDIFSDKPLKKSRGNDGWDQNSQAASESGEITTSSSTTSSDDD